MLYNREHTVVYYVDLNIGEENSDVDGSVAMAWRLHLKHQEA